eukprot:jgi/Ulvmu1/3021/UM015_0061.1
MLGSLNSRCLPRLCCFLHSSTVAATKWDGPRPKIRCTLRHRAQAVAQSDSNVAAAQGPSSAAPPSTATGLVLSSQANYYRVRLDSEGVNARAASGVELLCKKRSLLRKKGGYVLVGDRVEVVSIDWQDGRALVSSVLPRITETADPRVANVDHFALVFSVSEPAFESFQVTRFLVAAESAGIKCSLLLNKCDLMRPQQVQDIIDLVNSWGYSAIPLSAHSGDGLAEVKAAMRGRMSVLAGPSGVGKSSIINALRAEAFDDTQRARLELFEKKMADEIDWYHVGDELTDSDDDNAVPCERGEPEEGHAQAQSTQEIAARGLPEGEQAAWRKRTANIYGAQAVGNVGLRSKRGRHTTRSAILLDLPGGGLLVDTPGFNYPSMEKVTTENVAKFFPEIEKITEEAPCRFSNCRHVHEPDCSVRDSQWYRYQYYVRVFGEVSQREEVENTKLQMQKRRRQGTTKKWKRKGGQDLEVARLDAKVHRRDSRTARKVQVKEMLEEELQA